MFRDCAACPEMVVMPGGRLTLGRYEVTVGEYRVVALATEAGADNCSFSGSWQDPGLPQTESASDRVRELGRRVGILYVAEPDGRREVSLAERR